MGMGIGGSADQAFAAADVHYLRSGAGVAKSPFRTATHAVPVLRGRSARPLFVTAAGMPLADAASVVRQMAGRFRLPDALRRADALARTGRPGQARLPDG
jgi:deoxyribonuclease V